MKRFFQKLNEPFPEPDSPIENIKGTIAIGIFIAVFLYVFQIGGFHTYPHLNAIMICINFGLITIAVTLFFDWFTSKILKINRNHSSWTLKKWIFSMFTLLMLISVANYVYYYYLAGATNNTGWKYFLMMMINTMSVGIFPVVFLGLIIQIRAITKNQEQASNLKTHLPKPISSDQSITLLSNNKNQEFKINVNDIFYMESMQNYVSVCYQKEGQPKKELLRNTIKNIETQLSDTSLIRCHRSFIVNTNLIKNVEGNAQGLRLDLIDFDEIQIPVSRKYIKILRSKIDK